MNMERFKRHGISQHIFSVGNKLRYVNNNSQQFERDGTKQQFNVNKSVHLSHMLPTDETLHSIGSESQQILV